MAKAKETIRLIPDATCLEKLPFKNESKKKSYSSVLFNKIEQSCALESPVSDLAFT